MENKKIIYLSLVTIVLLGTLLFFGWFIKKAIDERNADNDSKKEIQMQADNNSTNNQDANLSEVEKDLNQKYGNEDNGSFEGTITVEEKIEGVKDALKKDTSVKRDDSDLNSDVKKQQTDDKQINSMLESLR